MKLQQPRLIRGGRHCDARGEVRFVNGFDFGGVDRFYTIHPARVGEVRGWVGHRRDWKWFFVIRGAIDIAVVRPDDWERPKRRLRVHRFRLSATRPCVLEVPPGYFAASVSRKDGSAMVIFSSGSIEAAADDNFRLPPDYWKFGGERKTGRR